MTRALRLGCRVVELDCYEKNGKVVVTHGGTMTTSAPFGAMIEAIEAHGFVASAYPVIVTLENHCKEKGQKVIAETLQTVLGDKLYVPRPGDACSPEALKYKVVVRDKPKPEDPADEPEPPAAPRFRPDAVARRRDSRSKAARRKSPEELEAVRASLARGSSAVEFKDGAVRQASLKSLAALIFIQNVKQKGAPKRSAPGGGGGGGGVRVESSSFSERKLAKLVRAPGGAEALATWADSALARVYPGGSRIDSSNYDPSLPWALGCQLAALNAQITGEADAPLFLNHGKFLANGRCGYVLKPPYLRGAPAEATGAGGGRGGAGGVPIGEYAQRVAGGDLPARARLEVHVHGAKGWTGGWGLEAKPDVYARVVVSGGPPQDRGSAKTSACGDTCEPEWPSNEAFSWDLAAPELAVVTM